MPSRARGSDPPSTAATDPHAASTWVSHGAGMTRELSPLALSGQDVFLRREAIDLGMSDKMIRSLVRSGEWARVRHGAYVAGDLWRSADERDRHLLRVHASARTVRNVAVSHHSAAVLHGMDLWDVDLGRVHLTRLDHGAGRTEKDVVHHEGLVLDDELTSVGGLTVTSPARAALESALLSGVERGLVTADSALRLGLCTVDELLHQHSLMERWPGAQGLQIVARLADGDSGSVGESRSRYLFWWAGLPRPLLQYEVYDGDELVGITDFAWPDRRLFGEFDGKLKYGRYLRPGEDPGDAVFREKRREDRLRQLTGWAMVRLTWADLREPRRTAGLVRSLMHPAD